jgi:hypothetical protein
VSWHCDIQGTRPLTCPTHKTKVLQKPADLESSLIDHMDEYDQPELFYLGTSQHNQRIGTPTLT